METDPVPQPAAVTPEQSVPQRAFLLDQIAHAPGARLGQGQANKAIPTAVKRVLGLDAAIANRVRSEMTAEGLLELVRANRVSTYQLTDRGRAYLEQHREALPLVAAGRIGPVTPPSNDNVRKFRVSALLLQLLEADRHTLTSAEANRLGALGKRLELNAATAKAVRHELAAQGLLTATPAGRSETYTLTPEGRLRLGTLTFDDDFEFQLRGRALNELLEAAREAAKQFGGAPAEAAVPDAAQLEQAILASFEDLLRERHAVTGMVPIHEVRAGVQRQLGEAAARHDVFDPAVHALRHAGRVRLVPITDGTRASPEQAQASIPGIGETLFFLETTREPVAR